MHTYTLKSPNILPFKNLSSTLIWIINHIRCLSHPKFNFSLIDYLENKSSFEKAMVVKGEGPFLQTLLTGIEFICTLHLIPFFFPMTAQRLTFVRSHLVPLVYRFPLWLKFTYEKRLQRGILSL